jgi:hypothetical protein
MGTMDMTSGARVFLAAGLALAAVTAAPARAQDAALPTEVSPIAVVAPAGPCCVLPAGTEVAIELVNPVGTKTMKSGFAFDIRLAAPVIVDGQVLIPAGTMGGGRVVQSSGPGIGGKGAKLVVSADYLTVPGGAVRLQSLQLTGTGKDHSMTANVLGLGGIAFAPIGIAGIAVTGDHVEIPAGTIASAKIAETLTLAPVAAATQQDFAADWRLLSQKQETRGWLDIPPPPEGRGQVVFFRRKSMTGMQWFNVRENGQALGKLTTGTYFIMTLPPGEHSFTAKSEPELKDHLTLKIDPGETYYVESIMTHGLVLGAAELTPSDKARFDVVSAELKPAEVKTADAGR